MAINGLATDKIPKHIAIIMDGNGRWAKQRGAMRIVGHKSAINAVRDTIEGAAEIGVPYLTLYAFSTENWKRPPMEVSALMNLLAKTLQKELPTLQKNNICLKTIGKITDLPNRCQVRLQEVIEKTKYNTRMTVTLALSYGARADIVQAVRRIATEIKSEMLNIDAIDENLLSNYLSTGCIPDPELLIRTSGEYRISNFLLWEIAYTELYITQKLWPDFRREDLIEAIADYQRRERRFGKTSEQIMVFNA
jgi:undecaprenyl diphosphate synthase